MSWVKDFRIIGGRTEYNKRRQVIKTMRRDVVAKCLAAGITDTKAIQAIIREHYPTFPSSIRTIRRDKWYLQELWETENRCEKCGHHLAPLSASEGDAKNELRS